MQGQLDLQCSLKRLVVADLMPGLVNAVMLLRCDSLDREEEGGEGSNATSVARLQASDHTGITDVRTCVPYNYALLLQVVSISYYWGLERIHINT